MIDCPICLQALSLSEPIGICAPCGHPFHPSCFERWSDESKAREGGRSYGRERRPKCPTCNVHVDSFAGNVFLGLEGRDVEGWCQGPGGGGGDGSSVSSWSDSPGEEEEGGGGGRKGREEGDGGGPAHDEAAPPPQAASPPPNSSTVRAKAGGTAKAKADGDGAEWKARARRYRRSLRAARSRSEDVADQHLKLTARLREAELREQTLRTEREGLVEAAEEAERRHESLALEAARAARVRRELEVRAEGAERERAKSDAGRQGLEEAMARMRERHRRDLDEAESSGMSEVQELLDERPRLVEQIRRLREQVSGYKRARDREGVGTGAGAGAFSSVDGVPVNAATSAARFARQMRTMLDGRDDQDRREALGRREVEKMRATARMARRMSSTAARISRAAKSKVAPEGGGGGRGFGAGGGGGTAGAALGQGPAAGRKGRPKQPSSGTFARQVRARPRPPVDVSNHQFQRQTAAEASTGRGLVLLGDTGGLRRGGSLTSSSSSSSGGGFGTAPVPRPVGVKRRQSSDIRSMFSSK